MITTSDELRKMTLIELVELALAVDIDPASFWQLADIVAYRLCLQKDYERGSELFKYHARAVAFEPGPQQLAATLLLCDLRDEHYHGPHAESAEA